MSLVIPYTFVGGAGNKARAVEVNANFAAVAAHFTEGAGGIADGDIATAAAIKGTKISNVPGNRIPTDRIEDDAITFDKLRDDATAGSPSAAVNNANHIKDAIITSGKMVPSTLLAGTMKINSVVWAAAGTGVADGSLASNSTGKTAAQVVPLAVFSRRTGSASAHHGTQLKFMLHHRVEDDLYYFVLYNFNGLGSTLTVPAGVSYVMLYVDKT